MIVRPFWAYRVSTGEAQIKETHLLISSEVLN
jgi:hypothetical protein